jgi:hypothetical protein
MKKTQNSYNKLELKQDTRKIFNKLLIGKDEFFRDLTRNDEQDYIKLVEF